MSINLDKLISIYETEQTIAEAARKYCKDENLDYTDSFRRKCSKLLNKNAVTNDSYTDTTLYREPDNQQRVVFTATDSEGKMMDIETYCNFYGLDYSKVKSYKLISHSGTPFYNIVFFEDTLEPVINEEEFKSLIEKGLSEIKREPISKESGNKIGVVKIADLHLGAYVDNLIRTKDFSINILANKLLDSVDDINSRGYSEVHVHILGDLIESFTGLSHKNTWKGLDKTMVGAEAVKLVVKILHENFLSKINNLSEIKVVAGNHDRVTSDNKEDVKGDAANLVCWGLELIGYNVEFNPLVITHVVDGICHILTHGHHALSRKSTKQICWDYGIKGMFNLICEGHLHSIIQKLSVSQRDSFQTIKDDAVDHRRMNCPSFFTGNFFSESLGYTSESGFVITENNGRGVPNVFYYAV